MNGKKNTTCVLIYGKTSIKQCTTILTKDEQAALESYARSRYSGVGFIKREIDWEIARYESNNIDPTDIEYWKKYIMKVRKNDYNNEIHIEKHTGFLFFLINGGMEGFFKPDLFGKNWPVDWNADWYVKKYEVDAWDINDALVVMKNDKLLYVFQVQIPRRDYDKKRDPDLNDKLYGKSIYDNSIKGWKTCDGTKLHINDNMLLKKWPADWICFNKLVKNPLYSGNCVHSWPDRNSYGCANIQPIPSGNNINNAKDYIKLIDTIKNPFPKNNNKKKVGTWYMIGYGKV